MLKIGNAENGNAKRSEWDEQPAFANTMARQA
jgi:hypothetical protein